jgi:hypothetical protein
MCNGVTVSSIVQTQSGGNVNWQKVKNQVDSSGNTDTEIWAAIVGTGASSTVTINLTGNNANDCIADICEYSGIQTITADKIAGNSGGYSSTPDTGATDSVTTQDYELWIGATSLYSSSYEQTQATGDFTLLDGKRYNSLSLAYLEKFSTIVAVAHSGTISTGVGYWGGCIAAFKGSGAGQTANDSIIANNIIKITAPQIDTDGYQAQYVTLGIIPGMGGSILNVSSSIATRNDIVAHGTLSSFTDPASVVAGRLTGGGAVIIGHGWTDADDNPAIVLTDYPSGANNNTLWLRYQSNYGSLHLHDQDWGSLELLNLTARGNLTLSTLGGWLQWGTNDTKISRTTATRGFSGSPAVEIWGWVGSPTNAYQAGSLITSNLQVDHIDSASDQGIYFFNQIQATAAHQLKTQNNTLDDGSGNQTTSGAITIGGGLLFASPVSSWSTGVEIAVNSGYQLQFQSGNSGWNFYNVQTASSVASINGSGNIYGNFLQVTNGINIGNGQINQSLYFGISGANLYLAQTSPAMLAIDGSLRVGTYLYVNNVINATGNIAVSSLHNSTYRPCYLDINGYISYNGSSIRFKENVENLSDCSWVYNLRPVTYNWKDQERAKLEGRQMGLIAEEVNQQCPGLVSLDQQGLPEGVHYEWLGIPLLVEVQNLQKRIETLETHLAQSQPAA